MSFIFNFSSVDDERAEDPDEDCTKESQEHVKKAKEIQWKSKGDLSKVKTDCYVAQNKKTALRYVCEDESQANTGDVLFAYNQHSDLVPNVYEGGMKIWECSVDLVDYLCAQNVPLWGRRVIELGCGAALPGLYAIQEGAVCVHLQDYNEEVLLQVTMPNVQLNCLNGSSVQEFTSKIRFLSGDWSSLCEVLSDNGGSLPEASRYDVILMSETIYRKSCYEKLHSVLAELLAKTGVAYLASKTHYFGVGGGTRDFESFLHRKRVFSCEVVHTIHAGVNREILKMKFLDT